MCSRLRIINALPSDRAWIFTLQPNTALSPGLSYTFATDYLKVPAGTQTIVATSFGGTATTSLTVTLIAGKRYTLVLRGPPPTLQLIQEEGNFQFLNTSSFPNLNIFLGKKQVGTNVGLIQLCLKPDFYLLSATSADMVGNGILPPIAIEIDQFKHYFFIFAGQTGSATFPLRLLTFDEVIKIRVKVKC